MTEPPETNLPAGGDPFEGTPYRWLRPLGGGGMGEVHLVEHRVLGADFVAKMPHAKFASNAQLMDRVRVEAQSMGRVDHPNVAKVIGLGQLPDGRPYLIMEVLSGHTLDSELRALDRLPLLEALRYAIQLCSALTAAHALGVVHRDIKPDNLFLHLDHDGTRVLKVLDFGVARVVPGISDNSPIPLAVPTDTGIVVGTPRYASPEACVGKRVDHRADIYGVGLVLYVMLAGKGPFDHIRSERQVLAAHVQQPPAPLASHKVEGWTPELEALVLRALAKDPADRFQTAAELEASLAALLQRAVVTAERASVKPSASPAQQARAPRKTPAPAPVAQPLPAANPATPEPASGGVAVFVPPAKRNPAVVAAVFVVVLVLVGLASSGAVSVLRQMAGGH